MFTGIIEQVGKIIALEQQHTNLELTIQAKFVNQLKVDQSIAHNGVCLTVTEIDASNNSYKTVAIKETLEKSNVGNLNLGDLINLERCIQANARIDGHFVQGHVDTIAKLTNIDNQNGSWNLTFSIKNQLPELIVKKGSICINGISLTVVNDDPNNLSVSIIPYTFEYTNLKDLRLNSIVNIEYDILGKYLQKHAKCVMN